MSAPARPGLRRWSGVGAALVAMTGVSLLAGGCTLRERICNEGEVPVYGERGEGLYCLNEALEVPDGWSVVEVDGEVPTYLEDPAYREFMDTTWADLVDQPGDGTNPSIPPVLTQDDR